MKRRLKATALFCVSAGLVALATWTTCFAPGCSVIEKTGDALADATAGSAVSGLFRGAARAAESGRDYSVAEEHYIGRSVAAQILSHYRVHPDRALQDYVNLVGLSVLAAPEPKRTLTGYHFIVLEGDQVQAVSAPGGFVFITEGTIRKAKDEDELAAVLAHEIAHVSLGHGIGAIKAATRKKSLALLTQAAGQVAVATTSGTQGEELAKLTAVFADAIQDITTEILVKGYSRDTELEADKAAATYLHSSGYAREALANYLRVLAREGFGGEGGWRATHPSPADRVSALTAEGIAMGTAPGREIRAIRFQEELLNR